MNKPIALIIDDEPDLCELLKLSLERLGIDSEVAHSVATAKDALRKHRFSICLTDYKLPDGDGLDIIDYALSTDSTLPIAMISAHGNINTAIAALKRGAFDFLTKPIELDQLNALVKSALALSNDGLQDARRLSSTKLIGSANVTIELRKTLEKVARGQAPVFISGESGSGKEVAAKIIHACSPRRHQPFIAVNCGAIPSELVESEFFGHKKGSFTGAISDKKGLFEAANGGTLLLDEIADLPLPMQVKLLRAIQERSVKPVGGNEEIAVDVRLLSATHKDLPLLVQQNLFRSDLYYRINVIGIDIPPLRERRQDIPAIANHIVSRLNQNAASVRSLGDDALQQLCSHSFPGNIRELENTLERSFALSDSTVLSAQDIVFQDSPYAPAESTAPLDGAAIAATAHLTRQANLSASPQTPLSGSESDASANRANSYPVRGNQSLDDFLAQIEIQEIKSALLATRWNKTEAAKLLGVSFRSLRYRMTKLGLDDD